MDSGKFQPNQKKTHLNIIENDHMILDLLKSEMNYLNNWLMIRRLRINEKANLTNQQK